MDHDVEVPIIQPLKYEKTAISAEQRRRHIFHKRYIVTARCSSNFEPKQRHELHYQNERLIHCALAIFVPTAHAAPDGDKCAGKTRRAPGYSTQRTSDSIDD